MVADGLLATPHTQDRRTSSSPTFTKAPGAVGSGSELAARSHPDGTEIAFTSTRDGNAEIYLANRDGSNQGG
jgi:Tol biopolymer transport system component